MRNNMNHSEGATVLKLMSGGAIFIVAVVSLGLWGCPRYDVWQKEMSGKAQLAEASGNRQIKIQEAQAAEESAKHLAKAEIERAKGAAEANRIIGDSLKGNEGYLRYLWIHNLESGKGETIYVPTEAGLPIMESTRRVVDKGVEATSKK